MRGGFGKGRERRNERRGQSGARNRTIACGEQPRPIFQPDCVSTERFGDVRQAILTRHRSVQAERPMNDAVLGTQTHGHARCLPLGLSAPPLAVGSIVARTAAIFFSSACAPATWAPSGFDARALVAETMRREAAREPGRAAVSDAPPPSGPGPVKRRSILTPDRRVKLTPRRCSSPRRL